MGFSSAITWLEARGMGEESLTAISERRAERSPWLDPRFLAQMLTIIIGLISIAVTSYVTSNARLARLDAVADTLKVQAAEMKQSQGQIAMSVQQVSNAYVGLQAKVEAQGREIDDLKRAKEIQDAWVQTMAVKVEGIRASIAAKKGD